jgi:Tfp pilus assembly protein PilF
LGYISLYQQRYEQALAEMERTVTLAPTEAGSYAFLAEVLSRMGRTEDALEAAAQAALRLKTETGVVLTEGHAFCSRPDAMYRKAVCKHAVVLALHVIRTPQQQGKVTGEVYC